MFWVYCEKLNIFVHSLTSVFTSLIWCHAIQRGDIAIKITMHRFQSFNKSQHARICTRICIFGNASAMTLRHFVRSIYDGNQYFSHFGIIKRILFYVTGYDIAGWLITLF